jgi:sec-independent protein translocase protein TatC
MTDSTNPGGVLDPEDALGPAAQENEGEADERTRMGFLDHLDELRRRILYSVYAIAAACAVTFYFWDDMFVYLVKYFSQYNATLIYTRPMGAFMFSLKVGVLSGLLLASPFVFAQLWLFVAPGLYTREKRVVLPFVFFSSILFGAGAVFGHFVAFPSMWQFFASYAGMGGSGLKFFPTVDDTFSFYMKMILGLGLVFQMPLLVFFLARFGIVSARFLLKQFKYAVLIIFIIAAVITPSPDMVTQVIFAAPMLVLYVISIGVAWMFGGKKKARYED